jgi:D-glycero-D-manno-heptose 1,7-bisphosphate phosphatase
MKNRAVFLDRDGTIIDDVGYLSSAKGIHFIKGAITAMAALKKMGFKLIVVTNQSGVARGFFPESFVAVAHARLQKLLRPRNAAVDAFYYCPHHPDGTIKKYAKKCQCRKPLTGMLKQAKKDWNIDLKQSYMIGDHAADVLLGQNGGLTSIFVQTGHGRQEMTKIKSLQKQPDYIARSIRGAAVWIGKREDRRRKTDDGRPRTEDRGPKTEDRRIGRMKAEG